MFQDNCWKQVCHLIYFFGVDNEDKCKQVKLINVNWCETVKKPRGIQHSFSNSIGMFIQKCILMF